MVVTVREPGSMRPASLGGMRARAAISALAGTAVIVASAATIAGCGASTIGGVPEVVPQADRPAAIPVSVPRLSGAGDLSVGRPSARPTVVNLWASWCGPCKEEMPAVQRFARSTPGVRVVGVAIDDAPDAARQFAREVGVTFPLGVDQDDRVGDAYGVTGLPTTLFLDRQGRLAATWAGPVTEAELTRISSTVAGAS